MANAEITKNKPENKPGAYIHKESGQRVVIEENHGVGTQIADAFVQVGFVPDDSPQAEKEVKEVEKENKEPKSAPEVKKTK
jgi:hypothetical protein